MDEPSCPSCGHPWRCHGCNTLLDGKRCDCPNHPSDDTSVEAVVAAVKCLSPFSRGEFLALLKDAVCLACGRDHPETGRCTCMKDE